MQIEEYVPTITPINNAKENPFKASPPNKNNINTTTNTVAEVMMVRDNVSLMAKLIKRASERSPLLLSRIHEYGQIQLPYR